MRSWTFISMLVIAILWGGCSGSQRATDTTPSHVSTPVEEEIPYADYEDFNLSAYPEASPSETPIEHDVPARLLTGRVPTAEKRTMRGYRIQLSSSQEKGRADRIFEQANGWWQQHQGGSQLGRIYPGHATDPEVYLVFRQPYYRVRLGNFASRNTARAVLNMIKEDFPDAFIVPDMISINR